MPTSTQKQGYLEYTSDAIAVASFVTIPIPDVYTSFDVIVEPNVAGTGAVDITGDILGSANSPIEGVTSFDVAAPVIKRINARVDSLTFTGNGIATSATFTVRIVMYR